MAGRCLHHWQKEINHRLTIGWRLFHARRKADFAAAAICRIEGCFTTATAGGMCPNHAQPLYAATASG
jgi:hypothetical protein